jgi:hypothetical protein
MANDIEIKFIRELMRLDMTVTTFEYSTDIKEELMQQINLTLENIQMVNLTFFSDNESGR